MENQRSVTLLFAVAGLLVGVLVRSAVLAIGAYAAFDDPLVAGFAPLSALLGVVAGFLSFFILLRNEYAKDFTDSAVDLLQKVTWPSREETMNNTTIVVTASLFFAGLLSLYDFAWAKITTYFLFSSH